MLVLCILIYADAISKILASESIKMVIKIQFSVLRMNYCLFRVVLVKITDEKLVYIYLDSWLFNVGIFI